MLLVAVVLKSGGKMQLVGSPPPCGEGWGWGSSVELRNTPTPALRADPPQKGEGEAAAIPNFATAVWRRNGKDRICRCHAARRPSKPVGRADDDRHDVAGGGAARPRRFRRARTSVAVASRQMRARIARRPVR